MTTGHKAWVIWTHVSPCHTPSHNTPRCPHRYPAPARGRPWLAHPSLEHKFALSRRMAWALSKKQEGTIVWATTFRKMLWAIEGLGLSPGCRPAKERWGQSVMVHTAQNSPAMFLSTRKTCGHLSEGTGRGSGSRNDTYTKACSQCMKLLTCIHHYHSSSPHFIDEETKAQQG